MSARGSHRGDGVGCVLPDGRELFAQVSFRVGDGAKVALVGPNGAGKTTLLRMVAGELAALAGSFARSGGLGVMGQFIGSIADERTLADLALSLAPARRAGGRGAAAVRRAGARRVRALPGPLRRRPHRLGRRRAGTRPRSRSTTASVAALDLPWDAARDRPGRHAVGGEQKRFALELLLRGPTRCCCSTSPTTTSTCPASAGSRRRSRSRRRPCCSSATTASCSPAPPSASSRWRPARPGRTRAASPPGTRRGRPTTPGSTSSAAAGTRSGPSRSGSSPTTR
jgi:hypothetical protein